MNASQLFPVVILAGGLATRLRPITTCIPKSLIEINNEPFIVHQLHLLARRGLKEIIICLGYLGELIEKKIGNGHQFGLSIRYVYDGERLLGTGGALKKAQHYLTNPFFVLYGDSYLDCDYLSIQNAFMRNPTLGLMTVFRNEGQWDISNIEYHLGKILAYDKQNLTPQMQYIDYGLGILSPNALDLIPDNQAYDLVLLYQNLLKKGQLNGFEVKQRFYEIGSFAGINDLAYHLSQFHSPSCVRD